MKSAGQFTLCLTVVSLACLISSSARADDLAMAANPYSSISERNIFALVPIPTNAPVVDTTPVDPPPKITPNGIMTLFGKLEVLFKVAVKGQPGQPPRDDSHVMGEGDREDDIEVTKIDDKSGIITFNNHGVVQELGLVDAPKQQGGLGGGGGPMNMGGGGGIPMPGGGPGMSSGFGGRGVRGRGAASAGSPPPNAPADSNPGPATSSNAGITPASSGTIEDQVMSAAKDIATIEQTRIATQDLVDQGKMPPLAPTELTPADATAADGVPLIIDSGSGVPPTVKK